MQNNSSKLIRSRVRGTFHQGDITIFSPTSIGRQCVPNCVVAAAFACSSICQSGQPNYLMTYY